MSLKFNQKSISTFRLIKYYQIGYQAIPEAFRELL